MSCTLTAKHPEEICAPGWHEHAQTPIIDNKYYDPKTGELCTVAADVAVYGGPPEVDIVIISLHEDTNEHIYRASRPFPVELLLYQVMRTVQDRKLTIDSLTATKYAIRVILAHSLTVEAFGEVFDDMANGLWHEQ